jgi:hypothetical protein
MGTILAIDPGKVTGVARIEAPYFQHTGLILADALSERDTLFFIENIAPLANHHNPSNLRPCGDCVIEVPQVYRQEHSKGDPNDLIDLAVMVGKYALRAELVGFAVHLVRPRVWKGQLPKDVCWHRVRQTLNETELALVKDASRNIANTLVHNMHDAIGLATWFQGRWK